MRNNKVLREVSLFDLVIFLRVLITEFLVVVQSEGNIDIIGCKLVWQYALSLLLVQLDSYSLHLNVFLQFGEYLNILFVKGFIFKIIVSKLDITFLLALEKVIFLLAIEILLLPIIYAL